MKIEEGQFYFDIWGVNGGQEDKHEMKLVGGIIKTGAFDMSSAEETAGILYWKGELWLGNATMAGDWDPGTPDSRSIYVRVGGDTHDDYNQYEHVIDMDAHPYLVHEFTQSGGAIPSDAGAYAAIENTDQLLVYLRLSKSAIMAAELRLTHLGLFKYNLIKDMVNQDFYGNVAGRISDNPWAWQCILNILGMSDALTEDEAENLELAYPYWTYSFSVTEKINTKKLIEGIASASPFIPHFNNMGKFKFDIIRSIYLSLGFKRVFICASLGFNIRLMV